MWRCFSNVIEGGLHYIDEPEGMFGIAKKTMFKVAFHSGFNNIWGGLMTIPEARNIKKCMSEHTECVSYEILRQEALETMDPRDPDVTLYQETTKQQEVEVKNKKERLIVNPEALPEDPSDGSVAYDDNSIWKEDESSSDERLIEYQTVLKTNSLSWNISFGGRVESRKLRYRSFLLKVWYENLL